MTKQPKRDEQDFEIEPRDEAHEAELRRIKESGETLSYLSAGAVRKRK